MNLRSQEGITLLLSLLVAYLLRLDTDTLLPAVIIGLGVLLHRVWTKPRIGFIVLLCLVYALPAVPILRDAATWVFVVVAGVWSLACIREWWQSGARALPEWQGRLILAAMVLLVVNFTIAMHYDVELAVWLRSAASLLPLGLIVPALLLRQPEGDASWKWIALTVGAISLSLACEALWMYIYHELWDKVAYDSAIAHRFFATPMGQYFLEFNHAANRAEPIYLRVASLVPETQGILIPAGAVGWFAASIALPTRRTRGLAILASTVCLCAVAATLTRSMIVSVLAVEGMIAFYCLCIRMYRKRLMRKALFQFAVAVLFIAYFNIFSGMTSRTLLLLNEWREYAIVQGVMDYFDPKILGRMDKIEEGGYKPETSYRLQEIEQVAYYFYDAPIFGHGLGTSVTIDLPSRGKGMESYRPRYVHNWVLYWLMVGGITGTLLFTAYLFTPLANLRRLNVPEHEMLRYAVLSLTLMLIIYGMFFAVFVTPPYTLLMAVLMDFTLQQYRQAGGR